MSSTVDNRVVRMTFDNAQFERNVKDTMNTLSDFEKSLKLDGATAGFDKLSAAAANLDLSSLGKKANAEANTISGAAGDAVKSIGSIDVAAQNADFSGLGKGMASEAGQITNSAVEAANSIDAIDNAADNADFSGLGRAANSAVSDVNNAAMSVDMSPVSKGAEDASRSFDVLGTVATGALLGIGNEIQNLVTGGLASLGNTIKSMTIDPIMDGFGEYETQIGSIQTILANTGMDFDSDDDIRLVNDALNELNTYADQTIYKFTDMTQAIGTFTAAGLQLDEAVAAVKGVSNVAAFSGAGASDVHRVLPQIAQALSAGTVSMQDWRSVETANMASRGFVDTIADMAVHMAQVGKAREEAAEAGEALLSHEITMRQALNKVDNKAWTDWFSSDILSETLAAFTYDLRSATVEEEQIWRDHLTELGYVTKDEQDALFAQAQMATRSATEVRTWSQLWDTVGEAIGSNWSGVWRNFLGDFKQATDTFTFLSQILSSGIDGLLGGIVNAAKIFNESGAIDLIFGGFARDKDNNKIYEGLDDMPKRITGALDNVITAIAKPLGAIKDAFDAVFGMSNGALTTMIVGIALAFKDFTASLIISDDAAIGITGIFQGLFSIVDFGLQVVGDIVAVFFKFVDVARILIDPLVDIALVLGGQLGEAIRWVHDRWLEIRAAFIESLAPFGDVLWSIKEIALGFIEWLDIPGHILEVTGALGEFFTAVWAFLDLPGKLQGFGGFLENIIGHISEFTGWDAALESAREEFERTGKEVSAFDIWISRLLDNPVGRFFTGIKDAIVGLFPHLSMFITEFMHIFGSDTSMETKIEWLRDKFGGLGDALSTIGDTLGRIASAIASGLGGAITIVVNLLGAIGSLIGRLFEFGASSEPVQGLIGTFNEFKDGAIGWFLDLPNKFSSAVDAIGGALGALADHFGIMDQINGIVEYFNTVSAEQFIDDLRNMVNDAIQSVRDFFDYFATLDPQKLIGDFVSNVRQAFTNVSDVVKVAIQGAFGADSETATNLISGYDTYIKGPIDNLVNNFTNWITPIAEKSESFPDLVANIFTDISGRIGKAIDKIKEDLSSPIDIYDGILGSIRTAAGQAHVWAMDIANGIEEMFPALDGVLTGGLTTIRQGLLGVIGGIDGFIRPILEESNDIPSFFVNLFETVKTNIQNGYNDVVTAVTNFKPIDVLKFITGPFRETLASISKTFPFLEGILSGGYSSIAKFFADIIGPSQTWGDVFERILNKVVNGVKELPGRIIEAFGNLGGIISEKLGGLDIFDKLSSGLGKLRDMVLDFAGNVTSKLGGIDWPFSDLFSDLSDKINAFKETVKGGSIELPGFFKNIFGGVKGPADEAGKDVDKFWSNFKIGDAGKVLPEGSFNFVDTFREFIGGKFEEVLTFLKDIPNKFSGLFEGLLSIFDENVINNLISVVEKVVQLKLMWSLADFVKGAGNLMKVGAAHLKKKNQEDLISNLKQFAIAMAIMGATIYVVSQVPNPLEALGVMLGMAALLEVMNVVDQAANKFMGGSGAGDNLIKVAGSLGVFAVGMLIAMYTIEKLTQFDWEANKLGLLAMAGCLAVLGTIATLMTKFGGDGGGSIFKAALAIVALGAGINLMLPGIEKLNEFVQGMSEDELIRLGEGLAGLAAFCLAMGKALSLAGDHAIGAGIGFVLLGAAITIIADAIAKLAALDMMSMVDSFAALAVLLYEFYMITTSSKSGDLIASALSIIIFSGALEVMSDAIGRLAQNDWTGIAAATLAIGGLLVILYEMTNKLKAEDLAASAASILIFAAAIRILSPALVELSQIPAGELGAAALSIAGVVGVLGLVTRLTQEGDIVATSGSILIFAAAIRILSPALVELSQIPADQLGAATLSIAGLVGALGLVTWLTQEGDIVATSASLLIFSAAIVIMSEGLGQLAALDSEAVTNSAVALGILVGVLGVLTLFTSSVDLAITAAGFVLFGLALIEIASALVIFGDAIRNMPSMEEFHDAGYNIIAGIGTGIIDGVGTLVETILGIGQTILDTILEFFGIASPSTVMADQVGQFLPEGIAVGMEENSTGLFDKIGEILSKLFEQFKSWVQTDGIPMLKQAAADFWNWAQTEGIPKLQEFIGEIFKKLGELVQQFMAWMQSDGLPMLADAAGKFWNWFTTEGLPMLGNLIEEIFKKLGELLSKLGEWIISDGLPALGKLLEQFWNWFTTDGIKMLGDLIGEIFKKLGELLEKLGQWIISDGIPAVGKALEDIMKKAGELGGMLLEWASHLPEHILQGLGDIARWAGDIGGDIIDGIIAGITAAPQAIANAVVGMASGGLDAIKNFFGIASPSKVMRDEVGKQIIAGLVQGITDGQIDINSAIADMGAKTLTAASEALSPEEIERLNIGAMLPESIAQGIINNKDISIEAMNKMALDLKEGLITELDIKNGGISRYMDEEVGQTIPAGIAQGIESGSPEAMHAASTAGDNIAGAFNGGLLDGLRSEDEIKEAFNVEFLGYSREAEDEFYNNAVVVASRIGAAIPDSIIDGFISAEWEPWTVISDYIDQIYPEVTDHIKVAEDTASLFALGKYIPMEIAEGIDRNKFMDYESIQALVQDLKNGVTDGLDMDSDISNYMHYYGGTIPWSIVKGMDDNAAVATLASGQLANDVVEEAKKYLAISTNGDSKLMREKVGQVLPESIRQGILDNEDISLDGVIQLAGGIQSQAISEFDVQNWMNSGAGQNIPTGIAQGIDANAGVVNTSIDNLGNGMTQEFEIIDPAVVLAQEGQKIPEGIASGISGNSNAATNAVSELSSGMSTTFDGTSPSTLLRDSSTQIPTGVATGIQDNSSAATSSVESMSTGILSAFNNTSPSTLLYDSATQIPNGVANGIDANAGVAYEAVQRLAKQIQATFSQSMDINSPSRVMADLGMYIPEGLAQGITSNTGVAQDAMAQMAATMTDSVNTIMPEVQSSGEQLGGALSNGISDGISNGMINNAGIIDNAVSSASGAISAGMWAGYEDSLAALNEKWASHDVFGHWGYEQGGPNYLGSIGFARDDWFADQQYAVERAMANWNYDSLSQELSSANNSGFSAVVEALKYQTETLIDNMNETNQYMAEFEEYFTGVDGYNNFSLIRKILEQGSNIYMDTGALVGAIGPEMDNYLGYRQMQASRGVY